MTRLLATLAILMVLAPALVAQEAAEEPASPDPPYEQSLLRLSEILGSLHYLRGVCGGNDGDVWRDQMQALLEAEDATFVRRVRLADAFNRGYDSYRAVHLTCTPAAEVTIARFIGEGARLAGEIVARYGDDS